MRAGTATSTGSLGENQSLHDCRHQGHHMQVHSDRVCALQQARGWGLSFAALPVAGVGISDARCCLHAGVAHTLFSTGALRCRALRGGEVLRRSQAANCGAAVERAASSAAAFALTSMGDMPQGCSLALQAYPSPLAWGSMHTQQTTSSVGPPADIIHCPA